MKKPNMVLRLLALLMTAALVLGALALVVYRDRLNLDALERWLTHRDLAAGETGQAVPFTHGGGEKLSLAYLEKGVLMSSSAGARYYSFSGEQYAEEVLEMENPVLSASSNAGVVYDAGGQSLFLFQGAQEVFDLSLEGGADLLSARVNSSGWLTVTAQQSGYKGAVTVYDNKGERVIQISLSSTFVADAALSPDCKTVAVVTMDQEEGTFFSQVLFYPIDQQTPSAQAQLGSFLPLELDYEPGTLWVLGEDRLMTVSQDGADLNTWSFGRSYLKGCALEGDGFALLLTGRYRAGSADRAQVIGPDGTVWSAVDLNTPVLDYDSAGRYCAILTGNHLTVFTNQGELYAQAEAAQGARYTALSPDGSALLANDQQAWLFRPG